jgi:hypothetical protein
MGWARGCLRLAVSYQSTESAADAAACRAHAGAAVRLSVAVKRRRHRVHSACCRCRRRRRTDDQSATEHLRVILRCGLGRRQCPLCFAESVVPAVRKRQGGVLRHDSLCPCHCRRVPSELSMSRSSSAATLSAAEGGPPPLQLLLTCNGSWPLTRAALACASLADRRLLPDSVVLAAVAACCEGTSDGMPAGWRLCSTCCRVCRCGGPSVSLLSDSTGGRERRDADRLTVSQPLSLLLSEQVNADRRPRGFSRGTDRENVSGTSSPSEDWLLILRTLATGPAVGFRRAGSRARTL